METSETHTRVQDGSDGSSSLALEPLVDASLTETMGDGIVLQDGQEVQEDKGTGFRGVVLPTRRLVVQSLIWSLVGFGTHQVLRFAFSLVLTSLLLPEVFGLTALIELFLLGLTMFSDVGLGASIIRGERGDDPHYLNVVWTVQVIRGFGLYLGACLLAWPMAVCYHTPMVMQLLPVAGLCAIISGFGSHAIFTAERHLAQGRLVLLQVGCYIASTVFVLSWMYFVEKSVWALIAGRIGSTTVETIGSHLWLRGERCRFTWDKKVVSEILHFGKWIFMSTGCMFLADQADRLIVGQVTGLKVLGVYNLAVALASAARQVVSTISNRVVFPYYSRALQQGTSTVGVCHAVHPWAAGFAAFATAGLISAGPALVHCLRPQYEAASWMVQLVAIYGWIAMLQMVSGSMLLAMGKVRNQAIAQAVKLVAVPLCAGVGYYEAGIGGMILGFAVSELLRYMVTLWTFREHGLPILRYDLGLSVAIALTWVVTLGSSVLFDSGWRWVNLVVRIAVVVFVWSVLALLGRLLLQVRRQTADTSGIQPAVANS